MIVPETPPQVEGRASSWRDSLNGFIQSLVHAAQVQLIRLLLILIITTFAILTAMGLLMVGVVRFAEGVAHLCALWITPPALAELVAGLLLMLVPWLFLLGCWNRWRRERTDSHS